MEGEAGAAAREGDAALRRLVPAGLVDAGLASLATFAVGAYAATELSLSTLGAYALFFASFLLAAIIPSQLFLVPAELAALVAPREERARVLHRSLPLGAQAAAGSVGVIWLTSFLLPEEVPRGTVVGLLVGASAVTFLSPLQDHVRRVLHLAGQSWRAAVVSLVQLTVTAAVMVALVGFGTEPVWIVFTGLAVANAVSLVVGIWLARPGRRPPTDVQIKAGPLVATGRWLVVVGVLPAAAALVAAHLVAQLASAEALGYAEAARIMAQPLIVLATGMSAVTSPRSMESARAMRLDLARRIERPYLVAVAIASCGYLLLFGISAPWNPLVTVIDSAYEVPGLVVLTIIGNAVGALGWPHRAELTAGGREVTLTKLEVVGAVLHVVTAAATAAVLDAYAKPLGFLVYALAILAGLRTSRRRMYASPAEPG